MASIDEVNKRLAVLYQINGISAPSPELENLMKESRFDEAQTYADDRLASIQKILTSRLLVGSSILYEPLEGRLTAEQYVLPPEMQKVHPVVLANITSGKTIEHFTHGGLLLYDNDVSGTGKTEYPLFLAAQADKNARFVKANCNAIRESNKPGTVLKQLYHELERKAIEEGVMYVVFIDEFEKLVNKYAKHHTDVTEECREDYSEKRGHSESRKQTKKTLEVDEKGEELFSTLKTLISGAEGINHVYTISASNQSTYPVTLLRRLEPVELCAFGIDEFQYSYNIIPDYGSFNESFARVFPVLQATHVRLNGGKRNSAIERIGEDVVKLMADLRTKYGSPYNNRKNLFGVNEKAIAIRNNAYLGTLLGYFGCDLEKEQKAHEVAWDILNFAGQFDINERGVHQSGHFSGNETSQEVIVMRGLTPDKVAKWYKSNQDDFRAYSPAKRYVGQCLFPQLRALEGYKNKSTK